MQTTKPLLNACIFNIQKFSLHDGPGIRTVVFFKGCPLRCYWCANPESQNKQPEEMYLPQKKKCQIVGEIKTIPEVMEEVLKDLPFYQESGGGVTLSGGEVLYQAEFAMCLLEELKKHHIHTAVETTGYAKNDVFQRFIKLVDLLYFDIKHYDDNKHIAGTKVSNQLILNNLAYAIKYHPNVIVRIPIIPGYNDQLSDTKKFAELFQKLAVNKIELLPFHQFGEKKYEQLNREYRLANVAQLHTEDLYQHQAIFETYGISCLVR